MSELQDLSVVLIAKNEERKIGEVLDAVEHLAHEIILVDSGSTDKTVDLAKMRGAECHYRDWQGYANQKNFAISLAKCPWILSLDADEVVSDDLASEIRNVLSSESSEQFAGYKIPRILYVGDRPIMHGGFYPDAQLRLFKKGQGKFNDRLVHESIKVEGNVGELKYPIRHYSYTDLKQFAQAMDKYAKLSAQEFSKPTSSAKSFWRTSSLNQLLHPSWTFFYRFVCRGGFLDGDLGLKANLIYSDYVRKKIAYLRNARAKNY